MASTGRRSGAYAQTARVFQLLELLLGRRRPTPLDALAEDLGVSPRQVRRDLEALAEGGHPTETVALHDRRVGVVLLDPKPRSVSLSNRERYALLAARGVFDVLSGTTLREDLEAVCRKVAVASPDEGFAERFLYLPDGGPRSYEGREDVLDGLLTGVLHRLRVRYRYAAATSPAHDGLLEPYALVLYRSGLYVVGPAWRSGPPTPGREPRVWAFDRFEAAEHVRGERFAPPADFRVDRYFEGAFGIFRADARHQVVIEFEPAARLHVEGRAWHPTQVAEPLPDGGLRLSFEVGHLGEVVTWVLGWGPLARAAEPPELVDLVRDTLAAAADRYPLRG